MLNIRNLPLVFTSLVLAIFLFCATPLMADNSDSGSGSGWQYAAELYLWAPQITATTPRGDADLPFYQIIDDLQFTFMGAVGARKDKWTLVTDLVYLDVKQDVNRQRDFIFDRELDITGNVQMKNWIVTPTVGYAVHESDKARIEILGGLRYLWLKAAADVKFNGVERFNNSTSDSYWDAIVGARATINLNEKWYMPIYVDIGTGDSDGTWQGFAGVGYKFNKFNTILAYRYLDYNFDESNRVMEELNVKGPFLGFMFKF